MDEHAERKRSIRARIRRTRRDRTAHERSDADRRIAEAALELVTALDARVVAAYLSSADEPGTRALLALAAAEGIRVLLPVAAPDGSLDWVDADGAAERTGALGVPEPVGRTLGAAALAQAELVLVPAAAVDRRGVRLGWGRGYYDRALASLRARPHVFAVIHDDELLDEVPAEAHDVPVDGVVRPAGVTHFG